MADRTASDLEFVERDPHEIGFASFFAKNLRPKLADLDLTRRKRLAGRNRANVAISVALIVTAAAPWLFRPVGFDAGSVALSVIVVWGICCVFGLGGWGAAEKYIKESKRLLIPEILRFATDFKYSDYGKIPDEVSRWAGVDNFHKLADARDVISGEYHGRRFEFGNLRVYTFRVDGAIDSVLFEGFYLALRLPVRTDQTTLKMLSPLEKMKAIDKKNRDDKGLVRQKLAEIAVDGKIFGSRAVEITFSGDALLVTIETDIPLFQPPSINKSALTTEDSRRLLRGVQYVSNLVHAVAEATAPA